ncbi:MAG: hypothetical protein FK734_17910 [Asgard group archaeon]|nr:hypothetical protein [Asgard group archaeon]
MAGIDSDSRIVIAEGMVREFTNLVQNKRIPLTLNRQKILTRLAEINSKLMALKWSYKPLEQILHSKELRDIEIFAKDIFDTFPEKWEDMLNTRGIEGKLAVKNLQYLRDFFYSIRERLTEGFSEDYADAIDILTGEILSIEKIDAKNWKCVVTDGKARYNIATNIVDLKKGDLMPIAKLPPQIVHGVLSEGMFIGSPLTGVGKDEVGKKPEVSEKEKGHARGILQEHYVKRK